MNLLFTICARAGSKGVKNKNIKIFMGKPLVSYTLAAYALFSERYGKEFANLDLSVNTDSDNLVHQIEQTCIPFSLISRKEELAGDRVSKTDVIQETVRQMELQKGYQYDFVIDLDLTSPLRTAKDIWNMLEMAMQNNLADAVVSVTESRRNPYFNMIEKKGEFYDTVIKGEFISRQQTPLCYDMNASIYVYRRNFILDPNTKKVFDGKILSWTMTDTAILDIDSEQDFELLEVLASYFYKKNADMGEVKSKIENI